MSGLLSSQKIGAKQGLRSKFYGHEWQPAHFSIPVSPQEILEAGKRYANALPLDREQFPEASAVWDARSFSKVQDIFTVGGGFFCIRGRLVEVFAKRDLGDGALVPFTIYGADLATPLSAEHFLLNFGAVKQTVRLDACADVREFFTDPETGITLWRVNDYVPDARVVVSSDALMGADLWAEQGIYNKLFLSDRLACDLIDYGLGDIFELVECVVD